MNKILYFVLIIYISFSCEEHKKQYIEIYEPKKQIPSYLGESLIKYPDYYKNIIEYYKNSSFVVDSSIIKIDPLKLELVYANSFTSEKNDLKEKSFITSSEIKGINFETNEILFSEKAIERIANVKNNVKYGNQFVLTINKEPILNFYFVNAFVSESIYGNIVFYSPIIIRDNKKIKNLNQKFYIEFFNKNHQIIRPNLKLNSKLYDYCKENNLTID